MLKETSIEEMAGHVLQRTYPSRVAILLTSSFFFSYYIKCIIISFLVWTTYRGTDHSVEIKFTATGVQEAGSISDDYIFEWRCMCVQYVRAEEGWGRGLVACAFG